MKYVELKTGNGAIKVSTLAIGSAVKMGMLSSEELFELFDIYLDAGGNCIDTARAYFGGKSEALIGEYMKKRRNRNGIILSTKGCHPGADGSPRLSKQDMLSDMDDSLIALGTDHVEIYWIHKDDPSVPVEEIMEGVDALVTSGKARMAGCSNWHIDRIEKANEYAKGNGLHGFATSQIQWSLADSDEERFKRYSAVLMNDASYDWYLQREMPIFAFSPQAHGFFSKAVKIGLEALDPDLRYCYESASNIERLRKVETLARERDVPVSVPVLAYLINNKLPCIPIFGATSKEMLRETLQASDYVMSAEEADNLYSVEP